MRSGKNECDHLSPHLQLIIDPHNDLGPVSRKSRELFGPEKPFLQPRPAYSAKLVFSYVLKGIKIKITAKFRAWRRLRFEDTKRIMSPEMHPKSFGTFEKQAPAPIWPDCSTGEELHRHLRGLGWNPRSGLKFSGLSRGCCLSSVKNAISHSFKNLLSYPTALFTSRTTRARKLKTCKRMSFLVHLFALFFGNFTV